MRDDVLVHTPASTPELPEQASELAGYITELPLQKLQKCMAVSGALAEKTHETFTNWSTTPSGRSAVDSFVGDIYSGLQAGQWNDEDAKFAQKHLRILSGLYGILKPLDDIRPYRLEMGYKLPDEPYKNLYKFWDDNVAKQLPESESVLDLTAVEYSKVLAPFIDKPFIAPVFLTVSPKTGEPTFVTVHAKVARGAFANWMIKNKITNELQITEFNDLNYQYDPALSTKERPVFVCKEFGGIGLSVRLKKASAK